MNCFKRWGSLSVILTALVLWGGHRLFAAEVKVGDVIEKYNFVDNHGKTRILREDSEVVFLSFDMKVSKEIHNWLEKKEASFLEKNKAEYIADITKMPAIITKLFAGPKMAKYAFPILLANDKNFANQYPKKPGKITVLVLNTKQQITHIMFLNNMNEVGGLISR